MKKHIKVYTDEQIKGITWASKVIDFGVSLTLTAAYNELYTAHMMLRERKDLFCREVKMYANDTIRRAKMKRAHMFALMTNHKWFDAYSDRVIDLAESDITLFRISLKQTLDRHNYPDSLLVSYIETARALLEAAHAQFKEVLQATKQDFGNYDYESVFSEFNCADVLIAWQRVCDALYSSHNDIDLNTPDSKRLFDKLCLHFAEGDYIDECLNQAHTEQPEFLKQQVNALEG